MSPERGTAGASTPASAHNSGLAAEDERSAGAYLVMVLWDEIDERGRRTPWAAPKVFDDEQLARAFRARALSGLIAGPGAVDLEVSPVVPVPRRAA